MARTAAFAEAEPKVIVSSQVPRSMRAELERRANEADRTLSAEVRRAIASHLNRPQEEAA